MMNKPQLSIIIPLFNECPALMKSLPLTTRRFSEAQVLVVDGGSSDGGPEWAAQSPGVRVVRAARTNVALQLNIGVDDADGEWVLLLSPAVVPSLGACKQVLDVMEHSADVVVSFCLRCDGGGWRQRAAEYVSAQLQRICGVVLLEQGLLLRRDRWQALGGSAEADILPLVRMTSTLAAADMLLLRLGVMTLMPQRWRVHGVLPHTMTLLRAIQLSAAAAVAHRP